jgi:hypothetical protein
LQLLLHQVAGAVVVAQILTLLEAQVVLVVQRQVYQVIQAKVEMAVLVERQIQVHHKRVLLEVTLLVLLQAGAVAVEVGVELRLQILGLLEVTELQVG